MADTVKTAWLALDIGAKTHTWASEINGCRETGTVENEPEALRRFLTKCVQAAPRLRILAEATGVYYLDVLLMAHELGAEVMVINPKMAHHFAQACGQRNKTDALDAWMLLDYLLCRPFRAWQPPRPSWLALRSYGRFLAQMTQEAAAARNRLHAYASTQATPADLKRELKRLIANLERSIERVRAKALALIRADDYLRPRFAALTSIIGVGKVSAVSLMSELVGLPPSLNSRACVCQAGLDPRVYESGTSVNKAPRMSRHGNHYLRQALFYPALTASQHDPRARAFKQRLLDRGKKKMQANVAIMRKMLTAAWAIMKDPQPYDSALLYADLEKA